MADISLIDPYSAQQESIARQRRMAQALQQQAQAPMEMPQTPGVLISPYAGLAKVLQGAYGGYQEAEADKEYKNLVNEARTNQAEDFAKVIGALKAPGQEAIAGQEASDFVPASYTPERVSTANYARTVIPEEFTPAIRSKPAIAPQDAREAGYIGPDLIASLKDPAMRQFAMAQAMAKLEPKAPISVAPGGTLLDARTLKPVFTANAAPQRPVALGEGQELRDVNGKLLATGPTKTATATPLSKLAQLQAEHDAIAAKDKNDPRLEVWKNAIANEVRNVAAERLAWDQKYPGYTQVTRKNPDGSESLLKMDKEGRVTPLIDMADEAVVSAAPVKKIRMDITNPDGSTKTILTDENDPKFKEGFVTKGPNYANITEVNEKGETVIRQVEQNDPILKTGYVKPLEGFFGQLQALGVPIKDWRNNPALSDMVNRYFVKGVGGSDIEAVAGYDLQKMEVLARLAEQGIKVPPAVLDKLNIKATPGLLGGAQFSNAAPAAANGTKAAPLPLPSKTSDYKTGQYYLTNKGVLLFNGSKFVD